MDLRPWSGHLWWVIWCTGIISLDWPCIYIQFMNTTIYIAPHRRLSIYGNNVPYIKVLFSFSPTHISPTIFPHGSPHYSPHCWSQTAGRARETQEILWKVSLIFIIASPPATEFFRHRDIILLRRHLCRANSTPSFTAESNTNDLSDDEVDFESMCIFLSTVFKLHLTIDWL